MRRNGRPGLLGTMARTAVITRTATTVAGNTARRQAAAAPAPAAPAAAPAPVSSPSDDTLAQLTKLGELKAAGVLDDTEFAAAKAKILGL